MQLETEKKRSKTIPVDEERKDIVDLLTTFSNSVDPEIILKGITLNRGLNYDWGKRITEVSN